MIDDKSPSGSWHKALEREQKRKAANAEIIARNLRIQRSWRFGVCPHQIAEREGVSVHYVRQIGPRWKA
jgi:hypothetical protein